MLRNYLTIAFRHLLRHRVYSLINITGLAIGMACCILLFLFVRHEWTYDAFHARAPSLHRVLWQNASPDGTPQVWANTPTPLAPALADQIPQIISTVRLKSWPGLAHAGEQRFSEDLLFVDPAFLTTFSFPLRAGDPATALQHPMSVVITQVMADKYFQGVDPVGQRLVINDFFSDAVYTVTGVAAPLPANSSIQFDLLAPFDRYIAIAGEMSTNWAQNVETYVQLADGADGAEIEASLPAALTAVAPEFYARTARLRLQPITDIHLDTSFMFGGLTPPRDPRYVYILSGIALVILVMACVNFMNLTLGRLSTRVLEVGIRKAMGAYRAQLIRQFCGEALVVSVVALLLGLVLVELFLPLFSALIEIPLTPDYRANWPLLIMLLGLTGVVGLIGGGYPGVALSRLRPVVILQRRLKPGRPGLVSRGLVVTQFALSTLLIICVLVMARQMDYLNRKHPGFDPDHVMAIRAWGTQAFDTFRNTVASSSHIAGVSAVSSSFGANRGWATQTFPTGDGGQWRSSNWKKYFCRPAK